MRSRKNGEDGRVIYAERPSKYLPASRGLGLVLEVPVESPINVVGDHVLRQPERKNLSGEGHIKTSFLCACARKTR
jgi:hypothetical protein